MKDVEKLVDEPLIRLEKLRAVYYEQNHLARRFGYQSTSRHVGYIAQEVLNVIPEIVAKPANEDGYYGLNYAGLTPILVKAIQEQQTIINDLKARIETLEAK